MNAAIFLVAGIAMILPAAAVPGILDHLPIAVALANAVGSFAQCGSIACPDNPTGYWLLQRLGRQAGNEQSGGRYG